MAVSAEKRKLYRKRTSRSLCRKKTVQSCRKIKGCKMTRGSAKRKAYCRKTRKHPVSL